MVLIQSTEPTHCCYKLITWTNNYLNIIWAVELRGMALKRVNVALNVTRGAPILICFMIKMISGVCVRACVRACLRVTGEVSFRSGNSHCSCVYCMFCFAGVGKGALRHNVIWAVTSPVRPMFDQVELWTRLHRLVTDENCCGAAQAFGMGFRAQWRRCCVVCERPLTE